MPPPAVIDTNVVVGGLLTHTPDSPLASIVDGMLQGRFPFLLSPPLLNEYRSVLRRPRIAERHRLVEDQLERLLVSFVANAIWREGALLETEVRAPDSGDDHLWALLRCQAGAVLVTGDRLLIERPPPFASVLTPSAFVTLLER